jgi:hypothetical protein
MMTYLPWIVVALAVGALAWLCVAIGYEAGVDRERRRAWGDGYRAGWEAGRGEDGHLWDWHEGQREGYQEGYQAGLADGAAGVSDD